MDKTRCFECDHTLTGPFCPKCNPVASRMTLDLAWSSRAFNIGLVTGLLIGVVSGITAAAWLGHVGQICHF